MREERPARASEPRPTPGPLYAGPAPRPPASRRRRTRLRAALHALAAPPILGFLRLLALSWRVRVVRGEEHLEAALAAGRPLVLCAWHAELLPCTLFLGERFRARGAALAFLVSPSVDGDLVTRVLERAGARVVRGSATRSGVKSLRDLYRSMQREGCSPIVLPDGPQGPARAAKQGALLLAQLAGAPLLPLAARARPAPRLPTWDRLLLPPPFARVELAIGPPRAIDPEADLERAARELTLELDALSSTSTR